PRGLCINKLREDNGECLLNNPGYRMTLKTICTPLSNLTSSLTQVMTGICAAPVNLKFKPGKLKMPRLPELNSPFSCRPSFWLGMGPAARRGAVATETGWGCGGL